MAGWGQQVADAAATSYPVLAFAVLLGSILPVVPTGAAVSAAAVLSLHTGPFSLPIVLGVATVAAFAGDCVTFAVSRNSSRGALRWLARHGVLRWLRRYRDPDQLADTQRRLHERGWQVLVISRLVPAGRIPVLVAGGAIGYPWSRFLPGDALAALVWASAYALLGVIGGGAFANPLIGMLVAIVVVLLITAASRLVQRWVSPPVDAADRTAS